MSARFRQALKQHSKAVLNGSMLCVDPASGGSSQPGWAYYLGGELQESGVLQLCSGTIQDRLVDLSHKLGYSQFKWHAPELLVVEELRGRMVHRYLHWSVGVIVSQLDPEALLEIPVAVWKESAKANPDYEKSDEADARAFGEACVTYCRTAGVGGGMGASSSTPAVPRRKRSDRTTTRRSSRVRHPNNRKLR